MQSSERKTLEAMRRVEEFLDAQAAGLTKTVPAQLRARIDVVVRQLADGQVKQADHLPDTAERNRGRLCRPVLNWSKRS